MSRRSSQPTHRDKYPACRNERLTSWLGVILRGVAALALAAAALPAVAAARSPAPAAVEAPSACPGHPNALGTARVLFFDPATLPPVGLQTYPRTLDLADHEVVLTFDDGPSRATTPLVLSALEHDCVRATFFLIGRNATEAPDLVRREVADGDLVAHHSWSHPAVTERGLPLATAKADIARGFAADDLAAYGKAGEEPRVPLFRFPGFGDSPELLDWLRTRHVAVMGADLWASDWLDETPDAELALLMGRLRKAGRGIVLLHDIKPRTAAMLPALLAGLKQEGFRIVALAVGPGHASPVRSASAGWTSTTEAAVALAAAPRRARAAPHPAAAPAIDDPSRTTTR